MYNIVECTERNEASKIPKLKWKKQESSIVQCSVLNTVGITLPTGASTVTASSTSLLRLQISLVLITPDNARSGVRRLSYHAGIVMCGNGLSSSSSSAGSLTAGVEPPIFAKKGIRPEANLDLTKPKIDLPGEPPAQSKIFFSRLYRSLRSLSWLTLMLCRGRLSGNSTIAFLISASPICPKKPTILSADDFSMAESRVT